MAGKLTPPEALQSKHELSGFFCGEAVLDT